MVDDGDREFPDGAGVDALLLEAGSFSENTVIANE